MNEKRTIPPTHFNQSASNRTGSRKIIDRLCKESAFRRLKGFPAQLAFIIAVAWSLFHIYIGLWGEFPTTLQRVPHLTAAMVLVYLLYPAGKNSPQTTIPLYDYILAALCAGCGAYHIIFYNELLLRANSYTTADIAVSCIAIVLLLEATRRVAGPIIVGLNCAALLYALYGHHLSGLMFHEKFSFEQIVCIEWLSTEGILGAPIRISSTFIFLFLMFATFLKSCGVGDWITGLAMGACGGSVGGYAKAAVVASALQGTVCGSSVANTISTGSITIPLMKENGYRPEFAAAVEAAASTGGQIMPPVMGAAALIMTDYVGCRYQTIALAACVPALLYFTGIFTNVHFEAVKRSLVDIPRDRRPVVKELLKSGWFMLAPIVIVLLLLLSGRSPMTAAMHGIFACLVVRAVHVIRDTETFDAIPFFKMLIKGLEDTARAACSTVVTCGCAGIFVGIAAMTGLTARMSAVFTILAGNNLYLTMILIMLCSLLLGMGIPTTANYIIQAIVCAPALTALGVPEVAAHMFVFYFAIVADITPPIALAAFAGSGIAKADPMKTAITAAQLGVAAYLVPYMFVINPVLVLINEHNLVGPMFVIMVVKAVITAVLGMVGIATGFTGYFKTNCFWWERALLLSSGVLLVEASTATDVIGLAIIAGVYLLQESRVGKWQAVML